MLDLQWIRDHPQDYDKALARRDPSLCQQVGSHVLLPLDKEHRALLHKQQGAQNERKTLSSQIGVAKQAGKTPPAELLARIDAIKTLLAESEKQAQQLQDQLHQLMLTIPNVLADDVPTGRDEHDNVVIREEGTLPSFDFTPIDHAELGEALARGIDSQKGAQLAGSRFTWLQGSVAHLHRALGQFMLDLHTQQHGYQEVIPPFIVNDAVMQGTGQLPKFREELYRLDNGQWLIPTAEVPLTNYAHNAVVTDKILPLRLTSLTPCFRSEAGAAGRDTRGMLRQHQFDKVELVSIVHPQNSQDEWQRMTACAEEVLRQLGLAWRVVLLCAGDTGFAATKTYDIEVWLPAQQCYREISSCSLCLDFQARRMKTRFKDTASTKNLYVHTLNGSGVAVGRALIAVMENYQRKDGSIEIPSVLQPYMNGKKTLTPTLTP
ncbi:MAG: serine--tRNA ligase [Alphaproteobacteria bacterium GM202ARS2]|nr:serine--tRNA ligase [Alphaproteobacteria bacterium GM202ARS2]